MLQDIEMKVTYVINAWAQELGKMFKWCLRAFIMEELIFNVK
jgi:hypothetical protein